MGKFTNHFLLKAEYMTIKKRIAFCGTRGVPANYGGFETAVDEITRRFVARGYDCDVFCRLSHSKDALQEHEGRRLIYVEGAANPRLETFASSMQTGRYLMQHRQEYEHVFWFNNANFPGILMTMLAGLPVTLNTDGLEWRRKKWSWPFKAYYFLTSFLLSRLVPRMISDSYGVQSYYQKMFWRKTFMAPYGVPVLPEISEREQKAFLAEYDLEPGKYFLQITRFEPDNLPLEAARAFIASGLAEQGYQYVAIGFRGDTPYALALKALDGQGGVRIFPAIYDQKILFAMRSNSFCYVHGNSVGGTNPALLEAMATCKRIMAIDVPFSQEVLAGAGLYFPENDIVSAYQRAIASPEQQTAFRQRIRWYSWDAVADCYMAIAEGQQPVYAPV